MTEQELKNITLSEEDLKESTFFTEGVHKVLITEAAFEKNANGKVYLGVKVKGSEGQEGEARLWFTGTATPYSVDRIRKIFVHNAEDDEKKQKVRDFFKGMHNLFEMSQLVDKLAGKECWYTIEKTEETYTDQNGDEKHRYEKSVWGYEPKPRKKSSEVELRPEEVDLSEIPF